MMTMKNVKLMVAMAAFVCLSGSVFAAEAKKEETKKEVAAEAPKADAAKKAEAPKADATTKKVDVKKDDCKPNVFSRAYCSVKQDAVEFKDYLKGQSKKDAVVRAAGVLALTYVVVKAAQAAYNLVAEDDNA